ncbi:hypothetical protein EJB05_16789 [Eragrostis curvula]|uniref:SRP54-type proteins GTP-binding domain-containing protein n=1 Tax=Eragrostis curvula TaxID=38414 RepID=A0A5J9VHD3_9POAL|nr:hypothetical protein EJB05_16789 [Eragrostis curvula]
MSNATVIDEKVLNDCLNEISRALLQANVQFKMVRDMQTNIKRIVNLEALAAGTNKRRIMQQAVFTELCNMLDPGKPSFTPKKGKPSVVMFVGLQGLGKITTCTKYAYYHQRKGFKPALSDPVKIAVEGVERFKKENCDLIIVDTSGRHKQEAALFEEMRQVSEATKPDLVIFVMDSSIGQAAFDQAQAFKQSVSVGAVIVTKMDGHVKEGGALRSDPVKIAVEGVERFKKENCDLIIVDTSGRHKQEAALFEEMRQVSEATKPDLVIFVMDSSIGQAAFDQAQAFKQSVSVGAVIVTKMDGHVKEGATKSPVIFIGTGEHIDEFEVFDVKPFVSRLLGMGDWSGFMDKIHEVVPLINSLSYCKNFLKEALLSNIWA